MNEDKNEFKHKNNNGMPPDRSPVPLWKRLVALIFLLGFIYLLYHFFMQFIHMDQVKPE